MWYLLFVVVSVSCLKHDTVLLKPEGNRYQYMVDGNGTSHLVDLWVKVSDIHKGFFYNADNDNNYLLYTRDNPTIPQTLKLGKKERLFVSNYEVRRQHTVILIHGWRSDHTSPFFTQLVPAFLAAEDMNVIMVDWRAGSGSINYVSSVLNTMKSGASVCRFIIWLINMTGDTLWPFHIVGHSLGGHQAGIVGRCLNKQVPYITVLDPAGPLWGFFKEDRCTPSDGWYTEVIHSDSMYGLMDPLGQVDFYPNGGDFMPGCGSEACSHNRAIYYFAESLVSGGFLGHRCDSVTDARNGNCWGNSLHMGGATTKYWYANPGPYYVKTNNEPPYSLQ